MLCFSVYSTHIKAYALDVSGILCILVVWSRVDGMVISSEQFSLSLSLSFLVLSSITFNRVFSWLCVSIKIFIYSFLSSLFSSLLSLFSHLCFCWFSLLFMMKPQVLGLRNQEKELFFCVDFVEVFFSPQPSLFLKKKKKKKPFLVNFRKRK